jgi:hypothetical protein
MPNQSHPIQPSSEAIELALQQVCRSTTFGRSARARALLTYLVRNGLQGGGEPVSELAIGLAVFGRRPEHYNPGDDPIVRVEAGRLRRRLAAYYAQATSAHTWQLCLAPGSYQMTCRWFASLPEAPLAMLPVRGLGPQTEVSHFSSALNDMLRHHLQATFGQQIANKPLFWSLKSLQKMVNTQL